MGTYAPPFDFELSQAENEKIVQMINGADPHVVFVGLGAPKQEKWINRFSGETRVNVFVAVGGSFDFYAGKVAKPPSLVVQIGLGWLWRIVQEPSRLWRRYLIEDSPFLYHLLKQRFGGIQRQP